MPRSTLWNIIVGGNSVMIDEMIKNNKQKIIYLLSKKLKALEIYRNLDSECTSNEQVGFSIGDFPHDVLHYTPLQQYDSSMS